MQGTAHSDNSNEGSHVEAQSLERASDATDVFGAQRRSPQRLTRERSYSADDMREATERPESNSSWRSVASPKMMSLVKLLAQRQAARAESAGGVAPNCDTAANGAGTLRTGSIASGTDRAAVNARLGEGNAHNLRGSTSSTLSGGFEEGSVDRLAAVKRSPPEFADAAVQTNPATTSATTARTLPVGVRATGRPADANGDQHDSNSSSSVAAAGAGGRTRRSTIQRAAAARLPTAWCPPSEESPGGSDGGGGGGGGGGSSDGDSQSTHPVVPSVVTRNDDDSNGVSGVSGDSAPLSMKLVATVSRTAGLFRKKKKKKTTKASPLHKTVGDMMALRQLRKKAKKSLQRANNNNKNNNHSPGE